MWKDFKPIIFFIARFFLVYILLTALYSWFLQPYLYEQQIADPITSWMADSAVSLMNFLGFEASNIQVEGEVWRRFILDGAYASSVNEGCNAVSVMIIFLSFIVAFSRGLVRTLVFSLFGLGIVILSNIARIALLTWFFRYQPAYSKMSHDYLFPAIIYGTVVVLWFIWVNFFAFKKR